MARNFIAAMVMLFFAYCLDVTADFFEQTHRSGYLVYMTRVAAMFLDGIDLAVIVGTALIGGWRFMKALLSEEDR